LLDQLGVRIREALSTVNLPCEDDDTLRDAVCRVVRRYLRDEIGFRPLTHCVIARSAD
jgi:hypothetical protein